MLYTIKPRGDVYCFKLNFNISTWAINDRSAAEGEREG